MVRAQRRKRASYAWWAGTARLNTPLWPLREIEEIWRTVADGTPIEMLPVPALRWWLPEVSWLLARLSSLPYRLIIRK
jgi:hypothetical protein